MIDRKINRTTAMGLLRGAEEYFQAFQMLSKHRDFNQVYSPAYYMASHALELLIKAYLCAQGMTREKVAQEYAHDLRKLSFEILPFVASFPEGWNEILTLLYRYHYEVQIGEKTYRFVDRYRVTGYHELPLASTLNGFYNILHGGIRPFVEKRYEKENTPVTSEEWSLIKDGMEKARQDYDQEQICKAEEERENENQLVKDLGNLKFGLQPLESAET